MLHVQRFPSYHLFHKILLSWQEPHRHSPAIFCFVLSKSAEFALNVQMTACTVHRILLINIVYDIKGLLSRKIYTEHIIPNSI